MGPGKTGRAFARHAALLMFVAGLSADVLTAAAQPIAKPLVDSSGVTSASDTNVAGDAKRTRFVIGLERSVDYQVFSLNSPNRVIVELPEMKLQLPTISGDAPVGLVRSFRGGVSAPGKTRVVIDVTGPVVVEKASIDKQGGGKPPRLVLEIVPVDAAKEPAKTASLSKASLSSLGAGGLQPPLPRAAKRPQARLQEMYKPVIVIDPGHGGHDSGAKKYGTVEKDVVLAFSLKLRDKLMATGRYTVLMTRDDDRFVELDDRRDFGDRNKAALFIAVHADYAGSSARGATIYSLRDETSRELQRSAKNEVVQLTSKENETIAKADNEAGAVRGILASLAQREVEVNKERTNLFSRSAIEFMGGSTPMMNNPDREANFRVLKSVKTPSVLIELAYVTNQQDAQNLRSDSWRDKVTGSLLTAIENYFSHREARIPM